MSAEGNLGRRWVRRLSVIVALVTTGGLGAGLALLLAAPGAGAAPVWPEHDQRSGPAHVWPWFQNQRAFLSTMWGIDPGRCPAD